MNARLPIVTKLLARLRRQESGVAMTEAIVAVPFLTILAIGVLEFGALFWQREQIETGLRDAARYMARCRHPVATCQSTARNLAFYGSVDAGGTPRVPNWEPGSATISFTTNAAGGGIQNNVRALTTHQLMSSPLLGLLDINQITITANHDQRVIGW